MECKFVIFHNVFHFEYVLPSSENACFLVSYAFMCLLTLLVARTPLYLYSPSPHVPFISNLLCLFVVQYQNSTLESFCFHASLIKTWIFGWQETAKRVNSSKPCLLSFISSHLSSVVLSLIDHSDSLSVVLSFEFWSFFNPFISTALQVFLLSGINSILLSI